MKREEIAQVLVFQPFKIVIETVKERNVLNSLAVRLSNAVIRETADVWEIAHWEVRTILKAFEGILRKGEGS